MQSAPGWRRASETAPRAHEVTVGGGHAGGQVGWLHFGLGEADSAEVRVQWPDGEVGPWMEVGAREFAIIERGTSEATTWDLEEEQ